MSEPDNDETSDRLYDVTIDGTRDSYASGQLDVVFDVLRAPQRRCLLYYLHDAGKSVVTFEEAVEAVCCYLRAGTDDGDVTRQRLRIDLFHVQFPRLEDAGILEYDAREGVVYVLDERPLGEWVERARQWEFG